MGWYIFLGIFISLVVPFVILIFKYRNPYKLIMVFGKKGAGKTSYLAKLVQKYRKKGRPVYSDVPVPGAYKIDAAQIGYIQLPEESVILLDEVGMIYDNRNFKNFKPEVRDYFKLQRHYKHTVYLFSQTWDIDLKLRNLTDEMYLLVNFFGFLTVGKQIKRKIVVVEPTGDTESRIADKLIISPFLLTPFGARIFVFIPKYAKLFDSHAAPELAPALTPFIEYPEGFRDPAIKSKDIRKRKRAERRVKARIRFSLIASRLALWIMSKKMDRK